MAASRLWPRPFSLYLVLLLGALVAVAVAAGSWADRDARTRGPEAPVTAYVAAIGQKDLGAAQDQLAPEIRDRSASFVKMQLGNRYTILESAVRGNSLLDRLTGHSIDYAEVVVTVEVQELETGNPPWRTTEGLPVGLIGGRWYLLKPPLQP